ncbi:MAG: type IV secretion system DNA-binding domain-containing protein [Catenibacterium mitsuokai]|nr:type IV secretion system DNA-binding domain-containing protein [Catenibacterium mitsuokai]MDD6596637.1 type IV secretion system DNA-binding domain-containing protein [Catenibacterium mitsuokai]
MSVDSENNLYGSSINNCTYHRTRNEQRLFFRDQSNGNIFAIDDPSVFKNILLLGGAGSGKTNVMNQIVAQVLDWNKSEERTGVSLIFDTKGDYITHPNFRKHGDYVIGNDSRYRNQSVTWNIFEEVLADGPHPADYEANAREIANVLFKDRGSKSQPFFANAARDIFANMIIYFIRRNRDNPSNWEDKLNNYDFVSFLLRKSPSQFVQYFKIYPDMHGLITYIGDGNNNQSLGVIGELRSMLYDCFQGVFYQKPSRANPSFSIRQAIRSKQGKTIFILYDMSLGETMIPIYRLLVDLALKEALSTNSNGHTHIFLDELKLLPKVTHLEDALNFGRSKKVSIVAGLQSVGQIYSTYGKDTGHVILGGFGSVIAMKTNDYDSREYISQLFGPNIVAYRYENGSNTPIDRERDGRTVEHWHIQNLQVGQAVVGLASQPEPFFFYFEEDQV